MLALGTASQVSASHPQEPPFPQISLLEFSLDSSNGYKVSVNGLSSGGSSTPGDIAGISVRKKGGVASYTQAKPEVLTERRLVADFGPYGRVAVSFEPSAAGGGDKCPSAETGEFSGKISFTGDNGFTKLRATSADGTRRFYGARTCPGHDGAADRRVESRKGRVPVVLASCAEAGGRYYAVKHRDRDTVDHQFTAPAERVGNVHILRYAETEKSSSSFTSATDLSTARVDPGGPFDGAATFSAKSGKLSGDLTVTLPGLDQPLDVTPGDAAIGKGLRTVDGCDRGGHTGIRLIPADLRHR